MLWLSNRVSFACAHNITVMIIYDDENDMSRTMTLEEIESALNAAEQVRGEFNALLDEMLADARAVAG